jgi:hypothetical protein
MTKAVELANSDRRRTDLEGSQEKSQIVEFLERVKESVEKAQKFQNFMAKVNGPSLAGIDKAISQFKQDYQKNRAASQKLQSRRVQASKPTEPAMPGSAGAIPDGTINIRQSRVKESMVVITISSSYEDVYTKIDYSEGLSLGRLVSNNNFCITGLVGSTNGVNVQSAPCYGFTVGDKNGEVLLRYASKDDCDKAYSFFAYHQKYH